MPSPTTRKKNFTRGMQGILLVLLAAFTCTAIAEDDKTRAFLDAAFPDSNAETNSGVPDPSLLTLNSSLQKNIRAIIGHRYPGLRLRYWKDENRTAWILNEIGKIEPITMGFVIEDDTIKELEILAYRESRGYEVEYAFFRKQFYGAILSQEKQLDRNIDNITGATLSVNSVQRCARLALFLHQQVTD